MMYVSHTYTHTGTTGSHECSAAQWAENAGKMHEISSVYKFISIEYDYY